MELNYFELQFFLSNLYSEATLNTKTTNIYQGRDGHKTLREQRVPVEDGVVLELLIGGERERWTRQNEAFEGNGELLRLHNYSATSSNPGLHNYSTTSSNPGRHTLSTAKSEMEKRNGKERKQTVPMCF